MVTLIARLDVETVSWVGTSMGGLIGMALAAQPGTPVRKLVLNDAGPVVTKLSLERIAAYVGNDADVPEHRAGRGVRARHLARPSARTATPSGASSPRTGCARSEDGRWRPHYDPRIAEPFRATMPETRTSSSGRCTTPCAARRWCCAASIGPAHAGDRRADGARAGPKAKVVEIPGVGHAPTLMHADQIAIVRDFLLEGGSS